MRAPTLTEALRAAGFGHRKPVNRNRGGRVIYRLDTGEPVERDERGEEVAFPVADGWEFLQAQTGGAQ